VSTGVIAWVMPMPILTFVRFAVPGLRDTYKSTIYIYIYNPQRVSNLNDIVRRSILRSYKIAVRPNPLRRAFRVRSVSADIFVRNTPRDV